MEYTIKPGETLSKIAQSQGTTVNALQQANNIQNPNLIQAGAKLAIPSISAENINTKQAIIPTVQPPKTDLNAFVTSVGQNVQPLQTDVSNAEKGVSTAQSDLLTLSKQLEGQTLFQQQQEQQAGLPQLSADYLGLQNQANQLTTEYLNAIRNREAQGGVAAVVGADQKRIQSQAASDIGLINAQLQAKQGQISLAQNTVDRAISLKYEPIKAQIETGKLFLQQNYDLLSRADKKLADEKNKQWDLQLKQIAKQEDEEKQKNNIMLEASKNGAPSSIINKMSKAKSYAEAISIGGGYMADPMDKSIKAAQLRKLNSEIAKLDSEYKASVVNSVVNEKDPSKLLSSFFSTNPKLKTNKEISDAAAVVSSANELAKTLGGGKVKGFGFLGGGYLPEFLSSQKAIKNRSDINALNLKVQQWASGASLTEQQTKYVKSMIPEANDTDKTFRTKVNNLTNYMLGDIKGRATTQGSQFEYIPVDLFTAESKQPELKTSVVQAISSGYKPADVITYVEQNYPEKAAQIQQARSSGYTEQQIVEYLSL